VDPRQSVGRRGEEEAERFLRKHGFSILDRNARSRLGEIDLVARAGQTLVFVEVKTRREGEGDSPEAAVTPAKQRRLGRLAQQYLKLKRLGEVPCRFDVVAVTLDARDRVTALRHLPGAFEVAAW
jgi:putative endonuclease